MEATPAIFRHIEAVNSLLGNLTAPTQVKVVEGRLEASCASVDVDSASVRIYSPTFLKDGRKEFYPGITLHEFGHAVYRLSQRKREGLDEPMIRNQLYQEGQIDFLPNFVYRAYEELFADTLEVTALQNPKIVVDEAVRAMRSENIDIPIPFELVLRDFSRDNKADEAAQFVFDYDHPFFAPVRTYIGKILANNPAARKRILPALFDAIMVEQRHWEDSKVAWQKDGEDDTAVTERLNQSLIRRLKERGL